ncbi:MAG: Lrp/AsnC family transcriptional regulator [Candidatus Geothermarchaeales archaeon]
MPTAFIMLNVELGREEETKSRILEVPGVEETYRVYGVYDMVVKIKADNMEELRHKVLSRIRKIDSVRSTLTMIVME